MIVPLRRVVLSLFIAIWTLVACNVSVAQEIEWKDISQFKPTKVLQVDKQGGTKGLRLKDGVVGFPQSLNREFDLSLELIIPQDGIYILESEGVPLQPEVIKAKDESGMQNLYGHFQVQGAKPTKRIVFNTVKGGRQELGKFRMTKGKQRLSIRLPEYFQLNRIGLKPFVAPKAPIEAENYIPQITPPDARPRLWMNQHSLPMVRSRLSAPENEAAWNKVKDKANTPVSFYYDPQGEMFYDEELEKAIEAKAFYYLMTADKKVGREAVSLTYQYLDMLEIGNVTYGDITRELGRAIYTGALTYDWCYDLLDDEVKVGLRKNLMRLVQDMAIGWPPFYGLESIINGHGNEAQICRDMLSWSIAVYDEDPEPYKYVSYTILEQLVPMRKFEYQSPRHNQGVDYGAYRFGWEMHAAWLYYRMLGYPVFDDNIKNMPYYWVYMRTPDGKMLRDGDMFNVKYNSSDDFYWRNPQTMLLCYAYSGDPIIKSEFVKQGGLPDNPVLFLLLNDPAVKANHDRSKLPLTKDFGPILGSMVTRTGWSESKESTDVVAEIKGGGYHFGNHQHADAGALQIYHHGIQVGDLGLYLSYGTPYDFNFNKRSVAHSMLLVRDPNEPLLFRTKTNDGGTRFSQRFPKTKQEVLQDSWYHTGQITAAAMGNDPIKPSYSFYSVDLTAAYSAKVKSYARSFLFLNLGRKDIPAAIVLLDQVVTNNPKFTPYWQINTLNRPEVIDSGFVLNSTFKEKKGVTYVDMFAPAPTDRTVHLYAGDSSAFVFGDLYRVSSPWPEANGARILVQPNEANNNTAYATVFQMTEEGAQKLPVEYKEEKNYYVVKIADRIVVMAKPDRLLNEILKIDIPADKEYEVVIAGLADGFWNIENVIKNSKFNLHILKGDHTWVWGGSGETLVLKPERDYRAEEGQLR